jgi:hypothetical protein
MEKVFDKKLKKINGIKWIPWIGDKFVNSKAKLLVLSESHYKWHQKGAGKMLNSIQFEKNHVKEHYIKIKKGNENYISVLDNLLKALYNKNVISSEEKYNFAQNISYCTIIQKALKNINERPIKKDFLEGWKIMSEIIKIINPKNIIILGTTSINYLIKEPDMLLPLKLCNYKEQNTKINKAYPRKFVIKNNLNKIKCVAIRHTSRYFSWDTWNKFIKKNIDINNIINNGQSKNNGI